MYFLNLSGEEFLDGLIAEKNLLEEKLFSNVSLEVALGLINENLPTIKNFKDF